jgi:hypothetical protein
MATSNRQPTAFVSYSWGQTDYQAWIRGFTNELRSKWGINANCDQFILQRHTKNLNQMMIEGIRDNDFVIIVLTESFKTKADSFAGGVGFEQILSLPIVRDNPDKMILVKKSSTSFEDVLPFHLKGFPVFDLSNDYTYEEELKKIAFRIHQRDYYEVAPLGPIPDFTSISIQASESQNAESVIGKSDWLASFNATVPKKITDLDKIMFMEVSYRRMRELFADLSAHIGRQHPHVTVRIENSGERSTVVKLYINGDYKTGLRFWLGNWAASRTETIQISYGPQYSTSDNSLNESVTCEVRNNVLQLQMSIGGNFSKDASEIKKVEDLVSYMWSHNFSRYL